MNDIGDCLAWPVQDPAWWRKSLLIGLLSLVPVLGQVNLVGWMLACLDRLRRSEPGLAPAGLYLRRGLRLVVVMFVYTLVSLSLAAAALAGAILISVAAARPGASPFLAPLALMLYVLFYSVVVIANLALSGFTPPIVLATDRGGIGAGLDVGSILRSAGRNPSTTLLCGLMALLAGFMATLGLLVCIAGVVLSLGYGYAVMAAVCRNYELSLVDGTRSI